MKHRRFYNSWFSLIVFLCLSFGICARANQLFGSNQQFLCRCTDNKCLPDGTCADGASCLSEWFGPSCQYQNLVTVYTAKLTPDNALLSVTDDSQCNINSSTTYLTVTWNVSNPFTFLWLRFYTKVNKTNLRMSIVINNKKLEPLQVYTISNWTIEIRSPNISMMSSINITSDHFQDLCSVYVTGGRNIALKQTATQDSYFAGVRPSNAIDGNRNHDWFGESCIHSAETKMYHYWTVRFDKEYLVNRYVLYGRYNVLSDSPYNVCCLDRLQHFTLVSRDVNGQTVLTYTENGNLQQLTYTVTSDKLNVSSVTVSQANNILNFCEFEAYGDSLCPPGKFGLECNKDCRCRNDEPCFTDTGTCSSGCAAGYTGMGCLTPCTRGTWDVDCSNTCSINCLDMTSCDSTTGTCVGGCVAGFKTPTCNDDCDFGTWGINCSMSCSSHCGRDKSCDPINGTCINGCVEGYIGDMCEQECEQGRWGNNCLNNCSRYCIDPSHCDVTSGSCTGGCVAGYKPTCEHETIKSGESDDSKATGIGVGIGIGIGIGVVITSVIFVLATAILYHRGMLSLCRRLSQKEDITEKEPRRNDRTEYNSAYSDVEDTEASGVQRYQNNASVDDNLHAYDAINLDDIGKKTEYLEFKVK
ncbi:uncharacterized protein LOC131949152 isoform X2 [Physella acuta]|uniref:uncharacterized protein LOC131949152 isoform X2 n=1 Tax=Physella acuta TaxID=109671 RepID=UPI0027DE7CD2|nr:uncharacterized protein LOC131949152 isoform X2 [Physella acuta]